MPATYITGSLSGSQFRIYDGFGGGASMTGQNQPQGPFEHAGNLYVFAYSSCPNDPATGYPLDGTPIISCFRSTDGGTTWAIVDAINNKQSVCWANNGSYFPTGGIFDARFVIAKRIGNTVYVSYVSPKSTVNPPDFDACSIRIRVSTFSLVTETWAVPDADSPTYGDVTGAIFPPNRNWNGATQFLMEVGPAGSLYFVTYYKGEWTDKWYYPSTFVNPPQKQLFLGYIKFTGGAFGAWTLVPGAPDPAAPDANVYGTTTLLVLWRNNFTGSVHVMFDRVEIIPGLSVDKYDRYYSLLDHMIDDGSGAPGPTTNSLFGPPIQQFIPKGSGNSPIPQRLNWISGFSVTVGGVHYTGVMVEGSNVGPTGPAGYGIPVVMYTSDEGATWGFDPISALFVWTGTAYAAYAGMTVEDTALQVAIFYHTDENYNLCRWEWSGPGTAANLKVLIPSPLDQGFGTAWGGLVAAQIGEPVVLDRFVFYAPSLDAPGGIGTIGLSYFPSGTLPITIIGGLPFGGGWVGGGSVGHPGGAINPFPGPPSLTSPQTDGGTWEKPMPIKPPNLYDCCLWKFDDFYRRLAYPMRPELYDMPLEAREWMQRGAITTPAPAAGDVAVLDFVQPYTYDGAIYGVLLNYTGTGFVEGSGDIIWRIKVGRAWANGLGNVKTQLGHPWQYLELTDYIQMFAGQRVQVFVNVPNTSGFIQVGASNILCALHGWLWGVGWTRDQELARGGR